MKRLIFAAGRIETMLRRDAGSGTEPHRRVRQMMDADQYAAPRNGLGKHAARELLGSPLSALRQQRQPSSTAR